MLDPEPAHGRVGAAQGEPALGHRMGETGRVEIEAETLSLRPVDPGPEVIRSDLRAVGHLRRVGVHGVEIQPLCAWDERTRLIHVGPKFVGAAGPTGVVSGRHAAAAGSGTSLETYDIVPLPAMAGDRSPAEGVEGLVGIDAQCGLAFAGFGVGHGVQGTVFRLIMTRRNRE